MQRIHKPLLTHLLVALFIFVSHISFAQYPGMAAVRAQQNQQFMNQQMRMQMMNNNWRNSAGKGENYSVTLKDSVRLNIKSYIYNDTVLHKNFLLVVNKKFPKSDSARRFQKIYPDQTINITAVDAGDGVADDGRYGTPTDSCWTFKVINGPIKVYAKSTDYLKIVGTPMIGAPRMDFDESEVIGIQFNDGAIQKLTKENVSKMISQNVKATTILEKKGLYEAVKRYNIDAGSDKK